MTALFRIKKHFLNELLASFSTIPTLFLLLLMLSFILCFCGVFQFLLLSSFLDVVLFLGRVFFEFVILLLGGERITAPRWL